MWCEKGSVALSKESIHWVVCLKILSENIYAAERGNIGIESHRQILQGHVAPHKKIGKKGSIARRHSKLLNLTSATRALPDLRKGHKTKPCTKKDAPAEQRGTWRKIFTGSRMRRTLRFTLLLKSRRRRRIFQNPQRNENSWLIPEHQRTC